MGEGDHAKRGGGGAGVRRPFHHPSLAPLAPDGPPSPLRGAGKEIRSRDAMHPSFAYGIKPRKRPERSEESTSSMTRLFYNPPPAHKGSGAPKGALSYPMSAHKARLARCLPTTRPPFGAHACGTRHRLLPRWLSSRTGFPAALADGSFARFAKKLAAVKHAPCGPVFMPVDRGPEAARERLCENRARAPPSRSAFRFASRKRPFDERDSLTV